MQHIAPYIRRTAVPIFSALTIALSFGAALLPVPAAAVPVVIVCIPILVALSLTATTDGRSGVRALLATRGQWRINWVWVVLAVALGLVMRLSMSVVALGLGWISAIQLRPWTPMQLAFFALILFIFAVPEEVGWRGYAVPKLLTRQSPLLAGLIIGVLWGSLHLALHLPGMIHQGLPLLPVVLEVTSVSVLATWLYGRSGGNLLVLSLFHASQSFFVIVNEGIPPLEQLWLMTGVYAALALVVVLSAGPRFVRTPAAPKGAQASLAVG